MACLQLPPASRPETGRVAASEQGQQDPAPQAGMIFRQNNHGRIVVVPYPDEQKETDEEPNGKHLVMFMMYVRVIIFIGHFFSPYPFDRACRHLAYQKTICRTANTTATPAPQKIGRL